MHTARGPYLLSEATRIVSNEEADDIFSVSEFSANVGTLWLTCWVCRFLPFFTGSLYLFKNMTCY